MANVALSLGYKNGHHKVSFVVCSLKILSYQVGEKEREAEQSSF